MNFFVCCFKRAFCLLLVFFPILSRGQSEISFSTATSKGEKLYFYLSSQTEVKIEGASGEVVNGAWNEAIVQSPTIKLLGDITVANFTRCKLEQVDLSLCPHIREISLSYNQIKQLNLGTQKSLTSIKVAGNRLPEEQMRLLVQSLPNRTSATPGILYAKDCEDAEDLNVLTPEMLKDAKARNWQIKICVYSSEKKLDEWVEYNGSNDLLVETPTVEPWNLFVEGNSLHVDGGDVSLSVQIYTIGGELIYTHKQEGACIVEGLSKGSYLVSLSDGCNTSTRKVLIP